MPDTTATAVKKTKPPKEKPPLPPPVTGNGRVVIDSVTRIEGHLRIEVEIRNGAVAARLEQRYALSGGRDHPQGPQPGRRLALHPAAVRRVHLCARILIGAAWLYALYDTFLSPTVRKHKPLLWVFLVIFHVCVLLLILGHLELFGEIAIIQAIPHEVFLGAGYVGLFSLIALPYFLFRRFRSPVRELSVPEDYYLLILLFLIVIFGSQMDWARRWYGYSSIEVEHYRAYLSSLLFLKPELPAELTGMGHSFMLVIHVFLANLFLIFFPFSQTMHLLFGASDHKLRRG